MPTLRLPDKVVKAERGRRACGASRRSGDKAKPGWLAETRKDKVVKRDFIKGLLLSALLTIGFAGTANAQGPALGPLQPYVMNSDDGDWSGALEGDVYWLENRAALGAVRYFYNKAARDGTNGLQVQVDVTVESSDPNARAGLLYGYRESPRFYYLAVVGSQGQFELYRRDNDGFQMVLGNTVERSASGRTSIVLKEMGKELTIVVNGHKIGAFQSAGTGEGAIGIAAMGVGRYGFTGYRQSQVSAAAPLNDDSVQPAIVQSPAIQAPVAQVPAIQAPVTQTPVTVAQTAPVSSEAAVFTEHVVQDAGRGNFPAFRFLVPHDWAVTGGVSPSGPALHSIPYLSEIRIEAPDERFVAFIPHIEFGYSDLIQLQPMQPYEGRLYYRQPESLGAFAAQVLQLSPEQGITNFQVVSEDVMPQATESVRKFHAGPYRDTENFNAREGPMAGERQHYDIHVRKLVARYNKDGKAIEETTVAAISSTAFTFANGAVKAAMWSMEVFSVGGPAGSDYLNDPQLATVLRSKRINPDWEYAIDQWYAGQRQKIIAEGAAKAALAQRTWQNTRAQQSDDVLDISFKGWQKREGMKDAGQANEVNMIHERTTYATPAGQNVNLPSYYRNVYTDGQGTFVLHNNSNYQINTDPVFNSRDWQRAQPVN